MRHAAGLEAAALRQPGWPPLQSNPNQRPFGHAIEQWDQIICRQMDAATGRGPADSGFVAGAVEVNVTCMRIDIAAAIEAGFQSVEPQNSRRDFRERMSAPCEADRTPAFEDSANRPAAADFFGDAMEAEGRAIGTGVLSDAEA